MTTEQAPSTTPDMPSDLFTDPNAPFIKGIDTLLDIDKADSQNEKLQSLGFLGFLEEVQAELKMAVAIFIEVNGHEVDTLIAKGTDINLLFADNNNFKEFVFLFQYVKANIEKLVKADGPEVLAHQSIIDEVLKLRAFMEARYPRADLVVSPDSPPKKVEFFFGAGILFLPFIFSWFTLRKGYAYWLRVAAFIWLGVFLYFVLPNINQATEDAAPAVITTEAVLEPADPSPLGTDSADQD